MNDSTPPRNRHFRRRWWLLVAAGVVVLGAGGLGWWALAGRARLGRLIAARLERTTGLSVTIAGAYLQSRTALHLVGAQIRKPGKWSVSLRRAVVQGKEPVGIRTLRASSEWVKEVSADGVRLVVHKPKVKFDWKKPLDWWRKQGTIHTVPVAVRDVSVEWSGAPEQTVRFDSVSLEQTGGGQFWLKVAGVLPGQKLATFSGQAEVEADGSNLQATVSIGNCNLSPWLPPIATYAGITRGSVKVTCDSLLVIEPRLVLGGRVALRQVTPGSPRWPKAVGPITGSWLANGVVVLAEPLRVAMDNSFEGSTGTIQAAKATLYLQTKPPKVVTYLMVNDAALVPLAAVFKPELTQSLVGGRGQVSFNVRYVPTATGLVATADGTCVFHQVAIRFRHQTYQPLTGRATFSVTQKGTEFAPSDLTVDLEPTPGLFQHASVRLVPQRKGPPRAKMTFIGLHLKPVLKILPVPATPVPVSGRASGTVSFAVGKTGPVLTSLRGEGYVRQVTVRSQEWGDLTRGQAKVTLRGVRAFIRQGSGVWGTSTLHADGEVKWHPQIRLNLAVRCSDLKLADVQRFVKGKVQLPHVQRPVLKGDVRLKGPMSALRGEGTIECVSLPVSQQTFGDAVTASFVILWRPSAVKAPKLQVTQQKIRLNLVPGLQKAWENLLVQ